MSKDRRTFFKQAGAVLAAAYAGGIQAPSANAVGRTASGSLPRGLTLLHVMREGKARLAARLPEGILDVADAAAALGLSAPRSIDEMLQHEEGEKVNAVVAAAKASPRLKELVVPESKVQYGPVVTRPEKILCIGLNYALHAAEGGNKTPPVPVLFNKFNTALQAHNAKIRLPVEIAREFDYEVELVIVIGKRARNVSEAEALSYVAGYTIGNDLSARELQHGPGGQWMIGKALDDFGPVGPYLVTADQVDPDRLNIECRVNGQLRQSSNTSNMIFNNSVLVSYISRHMTLKPGDIIFTGTPEGVIRGMQKEKQVWLKAGDVVTSRIEKLGEQRIELV